VKRALVVLAHLGVAVLAGYLIAWHWNDLLSQACACIAFAVVYVWVLGAAKRVAGIVARDNKARRATRAARAQYQPPLPLTMRVREGEIANALFQMGARKHTVAGCSVDLVWADDRIVRLVHQGVCLMKPVVR
jgi:hypothetical protein